MQQRYQVVQAVSEDVSGLGVVAAKFGGSRHSVHGLLRRYEGHGVEGLANGSHKPKSMPHRMPPHVEAVVFGKPDTADGCTEL